MATVTDIDKELTAWIQEQIANDWDPAGRIASGECASNRLILDLHTSRNGFCITCGGTAPCLTKRFLALRWDREPGYRPEWSPDRLGPLV